jgi:NADH-quinone oxidoreductase subunit L
VFVTALYTFRMFFLVFHGEERIDPRVRVHLHESPLVVTGPLVLLAIPSLAIGALTIGLVLFGPWFGDSIRVLPEHDVLGHMAEGFHGPLQFLVHGLTGVPFVLAMAGVATAWVLYLKSPALPAQLRDRLAAVHRLLVHKYYFDEFYERFIAAGTRSLGRVFWRVGDEIVIDGAIVNGSARTVGWASTVARRLQSGYLYHYAFAMIIGLAALLGWLLARG